MTSDGENKNTCNINKFQNFESLRLEAATDKNLFFFFNKRNTFV